MSSILRVDQILNTNGSSEITLGKVNHTDTTDASVPSAASIYTPGGIAALKDLSVGTTITVGGNIILSDTSILVGKASIADISTGTNDTKFVTPLSLASSGIIPAGALISYAGSTAPTGWLLCDGTAKSQTTYANLFAAIGSTWVTLWTAGLVVPAGGYLKDSSGDIYYSAAGGTTAGASLAADSGVTDWTSSTNFLVPNGQGIGITGAGTQDINGRAKGGNLLGETVEDTMQGHYHGASVTTYKNNGASGAGANNVGPTDPYAYNNMALDYYGVTAPTTDGSNGTPRTGAETTISSIVANFIIKY